jgi:hypothetical protein
MAMITGKGIGFLIAAIALFFLGRLTQVGWLYLIDAVLWGIPAGGWSSLALGKGGTARRKATAWTSR